MVGMTSMKPSPKFRVKLFEQLAERLRQAGAQYPVAATVALVARGDSELDATEFATQNSIALELLESIERGEVDLETTLEQYEHCLPDDIERMLGD